MPTISPLRSALAALSNAASLLALVSYPIAVETMVGATAQLVIWSASYAAFVIACSYPPGNAGNRPTSPPVFVMLVMLRSSHEARAAFILGGLTRWNPGSSTS